MRPQDLLQALTLVTDRSVVLVDVVIFGSPQDFDCFARTYEVRLIVEGDTIVLYDAQSFTENIILIVTRREYVVQKRGVRITSRVYNHSVGDIHV